MMLIDVENVFFKKDNESRMLVSVFVANKSQEGFAQEGFVQSVEMLKETFKSSKICLKGKMFLKSDRKLEESFSLVLVFINEVCVHCTPKSFHPTFISPHIHFTPQSFHPTFISPHFHFTLYCNYTKASHVD